MFWPAWLIIRLLVWSSKINVAFGMGPASGFCRVLSNLNVLPPHALLKNKFNRLSMHCLDESNLVNIPVRSMKKYNIAFRINCNSRGLTLYGWGPFGIHYVIVRISFNHSSFLEKMKRFNNQSQYLFYLIIDFTDRCSFFFHVGLGSSCQCLRLIVMRRIIIVLGWGTRFSMNVMNIFVICIMTMPFFLGDSNAFSIFYVKDVIITLLLLCKFAQISKWITRSGKSRTIEYLLDWWTFFH